MKRIGKRLVILLWLCGTSMNTRAGSESTQSPSLISMDYQVLTTLRQQVQAGDPALRPAYEKLVARATALLTVVPEQVTDGDVPPSGDQHDFYAIGRLSWPNPATPDGKPYLRRDGITNPEADGPRYDLYRYNLTLSRINDLSLAWFYSGDERFAAKAATLLRVWFLNPDTRMNPNLKNASALPGVYDGMPVGIIFGVALIKMVDHVQLLALSNSWTSADNASLKKWFADYTTWLLTSELGQKEAAGTNNHGTWYSAQVTAFSLYSGHPERIQPMIALTKKQIQQQIEKDGSLPRELTRQRSLHYSVYGLQAFTYMARCADIVREEDLWHYQTSDGRGLELAFQFLLPYLVNEKEWTWTNIEAGRPQVAGALEITRLAAQKYDTTPYLNAAKYLTARTAPDSVARLTGVIPD